MKSARVIINPPWGGPPPAGWPGSSGRRGISKGGDLIKESVLKIKRRAVDFIMRRDVELSGIEYWRYRTKKYGRFAVFNLDRSESEMDEVTARQKAEIFPIFRSALRGDEALLLDLGCGAGRFTADLAEIVKGKAIGVDPIEELLNMAPRTDKTEYIPMQEGIIPLRESYVDIVWVYGVLGCIRDEALAGTISEIDRVLKERGLLFLIEGVDGRGSKSYEVRGFDEYKKMLHFAPLSYLHDYYDCKTKFAVMAGRKGEAANHPPMAAS